MPRDPDSGPWVPRADVFVNPAGDLAIKVELASMRREGLELAVEGNRLMVRGQRTNTDAPDAGCKYLITEIDWGSFEMVFDVPAGFDLARATALYQNGLLQVAVPRSN